MHPFHPLHERSYLLESCRQAWGEWRVYFYDDEGRLRHLPASWTDVEAVDPFVAVGAGRVHFRVEDLIDLAELLDHLKEGR